MDNESIVTFIKKHNLIENNITVIIGLSGGPDSIFLLHFLHEIQKKFSLHLIAAHLDHEWRSNSSADVIFCANACKKLGISFISKKASELTGNFKKNGSQEALGRMLRRSFLESIRQEYGAHAIAIAHHEQDQQETFFIRLIRGTSLSGLTCMRPKAGYYIRPLLQTSKQAILNYLHQHTIDYLIDPTNNSESYLRNRIRLNVVPTFHKADQRFDTNFLRTITSLQETEDFLVDLTSKTFDTLATTQNGTYYVSITEFLSLKSILQHRILMHWLILQEAPFVPTQASLNEIVRFLRNNKSTQHALSPSWTLAKKKNNAFIVKS